ncbi:hypothetical protein CAP35_13210 [Chitinophagaceae bacterium IBVUCB1]|nr:hypothetical protein CAP35_13210 [Chitinophagaceae bacterium IBVUCB1]
MLLSSTCYAQRSLCDSMVLAVQLLPPEEAQEGEDNKRRKKLSIAYRFDTKKTLHIDREARTLQLTDERGQVLAKGTYANLASTNTLYAQGNWKFYHPNGQLKEEGSYLKVPYAWATTHDAKTTQSVKYQSIRDGEWRYYDADGKLTGREVYD